MCALNYQQKNPLYAVEKVKRDLALDLYEGGARVEKKREYLIPHPYETPKQYDIRFDRATYRNFAAPIVDVFGSFVCDNRPERKLPDALIEIARNVDRQNTTADVFFGNVVRLAAAAGARFVLVDMEQAKGGTVAEDRQKGRYDKPYFLNVDADDVYDWAMDDRGLVWAVIHSVETVKSNPFEDLMVKDVLTVWTRNEWRRVVGNARVASAAIVPSVENMQEEGSGKHQLGEVPLVPFLFEPTTPMTGNPATDDVLSLILRVYRRDSELDKMLFDSAIPLGVFNGLSQEAAKEFIRSSSNILVSSEPSGIDGKYIEPQGNSFTAIRESLENDIASIREIALRMVRPQTAVGESAEAKNIDKQQLDTQLANYARRCGGAERKCWELAYKWLNNGKEPKEGDIETPYNEDYSVKDVEKIDRDYLMEMYRGGVISRQTFFEMLQEIGGLPANYLVKDEARRIEQDRKADEGPTGVKLGQSSLASVLGA